MSRLIFEGDTVSRFGKKIPTPFIEKIKIFENKIETEIAIYLHITEDATTNQEIYGDLNNFVLFTTGETIGASIEDSFEIVSDRIYNSQAQRFAKLFYKESKNFNFETLGDREFYYHCYVSILSDEDENPNINLVESTRNLQADAVQAEEYSQRRNFSSPLVYEKVLNFGGFLSNEPVVIYEDASGLPYESVPLQSIQKGFYKTTETFREQLKKEIDNLVASYGTTEDQQLQSLLDSISFIAQTKSEDVDFIVELDKVRNSFPSRTSTSAVGTLYNRLKDILFSANDALLLGESLQKKLVPNTKLIDLRDTISGTVSGQEWGRRNELSYEPRVDDSGTFLYSKVMMERQELETSELLTEPNFDVTSIFGYFFLDYEKALHGKSNISQIYEVEKLLNILGNNALDLFFPITKTEVIKFNSGARVRTIETAYLKNRQDGNNLLTAATSDKVVDKVVLTEADGTSTTTIPYTLMRGFDLVESLGDYRLLAFEFQDFEASTDSTDSGQSYRFNVYIEDNTLDFYQLLIAQFEATLSAVNDYLSYASEFCSYNNIDNKFNDFFVEAIEQLYGSRFPWSEAARVFAIHLDLLNNVSDGIKSVIIDNAQNQADLISPRNGTLDALQDFVERMNSFYEKYYGDGGEVTIQIVSRRNADGTYGPSLRDNTQFIATLGFDALPNIVDFSVENYGQSDDTNGDTDGGGATPRGEAIIVEGGGFEVATPDDLTSGGAEGSDSDGSGDNRSDSGGSTEVGGGGTGAATQGPGI